MSTEKSNPTIAIHTLRTTSDAQALRFVDDGRFIKDFSDLGYSLTLSSRDTFDNGVVRNPVVDRDGSVRFEPALLGADSLSSMYVHLTNPVHRAGSETIPKLNANELKLIAGSKIDLYEKVLSNYQVETRFLSMSDGVFADMADLVHNVATENVVIKANDGTGGESTQIMTKKDALAWIGAELESERTQDYILQPQISFGPLPVEIRANGTPEEQALVERSRVDNLLTELRLYVAKRGEEADVVPVLRIVPDKLLTMKGQNDIYVDVALPDDLAGALDASARDILKRATLAAGNIQFALGAIDFYFDEFGLPHVMEANFRSPGLPRTRETPIAGRAIHQHIAKTLVAMDRYKEGV